MRVVKVKKVLKFTGKMGLLSSNRTLSPIFNIHEKQMKR